MLGVPKTFHTKKSKLPRLILFKFYYKYCNFEAIAQRRSRTVSNRDEIALSEI